MNVNALMAKADPPDDERLRGHLGPTWAFFDELRGATAACEHEWKHHGNKYGWKLRVHANGKSVLELTVAEGWFLVTIAVREDERQALAADRAAAVGEAPAPEGYGIKIELRDAASWEKAKGIIAYVVGARGLAT